MQVVPEICVDSATVLAPMRLESIPCYFVIPLSFGAAFHLYSEPGMVAGRRYRSQQGGLSRMGFETLNRSTRRESLTVQGSPYDILPSFSVNAGKPGVPGVSSECRQIQFS